MGCIMKVTMETSVAGIQEYEFASKLLELIAHAIMFGYIHFWKWLYGIGSKHLK